MAAGGRRSVRADPGVGRRDLRGASLEQIAALNERLHLRVRHRALLHPEAAVGVDVFAAVCAHEIDRRLDALSHCVRVFLTEAMEVSRPLTSRTVVLR